MDSASEQSNVTFKIEDLPTRASYAGLNPQRSLARAAERSKQFRSAGTTRQIRVRGRGAGTVMSGETDHGTDGRRGLRHDKD